MNPGMELGFASLVVIVVVLLDALDAIVGTRSGVGGTIGDAEGPRTQDCLDLRAPLSMVWPSKRFANAG